MHPGGEDKFERLVGLVKRSLCKGIGRASLFWKELEEVLLDVEVILKKIDHCVTWRMIYNCRF